VLRRVARSPRPLAAPDRRAATADEPPPVERVLGLPPRAFVLLVGLLLAPILTWTPLLQYMGWFLTSLVHETGHTAAAWLAACPAFPAISLAGHAAAVHRDPVPTLRVLYAAGFLAWGWAWRASPRRLAVVASAALLWVLLTLTSAREAFFLGAGHLGELAFALYALVQATSGGFSGTIAERCAHAGVGLYLVGRDLRLGWGIRQDAGARAAYVGNGSFGLENDLVRLARDEFHVSLATMGGLLTASAVLVLVAGLGWALLRSDA
jgi:hypothetical protein